jgi:hypothetical protein
MVQGHANTVLCAALGVTSACRKAQQRLQHQRTSTCYPQISKQRNVPAAPAAQGHVAASKDLHM